MSNFDDILNQSKKNVQVPAPKEIVVKPLDSEENKEKKESQIWNKDKRIHSTQLTKRTFKLAYESRQPKDNLLFHSDQGANYTSRTFMTYLKQLNVQQSFSRKGTPYDNSVCESFFANMKREELYRRNYKTKTEFFNGVHNYIAFYNSERPHSLLRYQTPDKYEEMYYFYNPNRTCVVQKEQ